MTGPRTFWPSGEGYVFPYTDSRLRFFVALDVTSVFQRCPEHGEAALQEVECDRLDLHLMVHGVEVHLPILETIERCFTQTLDLGQRFASILARECQHRHIERVLQELGHVPAEAIERMPVVHRVVSFERRIAMRARAAWRERLFDDLTYRFASEAA